MKNKKIRMTYQIYVQLMMSLIQMTAEIGSPAQRANVQEGSFCLTHLYQTIRFLNTPVT